MKAQNAIFSKLIKTYLWSKMLQERVFGYISHRNQSGKLSYEKMIKDFLVIYASCISNWLGFYVLLK